MTCRILDCCTLINLYCGWGGIQKLHDFGDRWCIGTQALGEAKYVREFGADGAVKSRTIDASHLSSHFPLHELAVESDEEAALLVRSAALLDDGEAEGLVLAALRGMAFCSDDAVVHRAARELGLTVEIASTAELLQLWAAGDSIRQEQLPGIVRRISVLAKFAPHRKSPHLAWWKAQLTATDPGKI